MLPLSVATAPASGAVVPPASPRVISQAVASRPVIASRPLLDAIPQGQPAAGGTELVVVVDAEDAVIDHRRAAGIAVGGIAQHQPAAARNLERAGRAAVGDRPALGHRQGRDEVQGGIAAKSNGMAVGSVGGEGQRARPWGHRAAVAQIGVGADAEYAPITTVPPE